MHMSRKKCHLKYTYIKSEVLGVVDTATYLGVNISKDLSWNDQVGKVISKANKSPCFIKRNINSFSKSIKEKVYRCRTIVCPTLNYAATVWNHHQKYLINDLGRVQ